LTSCNIRRARARGGSEVFLEANQAAWDSIWVTLVEAAPPIGMLRGFIAS
jgi:hypothetical protein